MRYLALVRYVGTKFYGFQVQPNRRTVQGELNRATEALFGTPCFITGCSRTDSGVHAEQFCLLIEPQDEAKAAPVPPENLPRAIAVHMPPDLALYAAIEAPCGFHPRHHVKEKEYRYDIWNGPTANPFYADRAWHYPRYLDDAAIAEMNRAAAYLVGRRDFHAFMAKGSQIKDTTRTVFSCYCKREGELVRMYIRGDGFLYNMVRIIMGTLIDVSQKRILPENIPAILNGNRRVEAGMTAPACGLHLSRVEYPEGLCDELYRQIYQHE